jgi:hypothetical protein
MPLSDRVRLELLDVVRVGTDKTKVQAFLPGDRKSPDYEMKRI